MGNKPRNIKASRLFMKVAREKRAILLIPPDVEEKFDGYKTRFIRKNVKVNGGRLENWLTHFGIAEHTSKGFSHLEVYFCDAEKRLIFPTDVWLASSITENIYRALGEPTIIYSVPTVYAESKHIDAYSPSPITFELDVKRVSREPELMELYTAIRDSLAKGLDKKRLLRE